MKRNKALIAIFIVGFLYTVMPTESKADSSFYNQSVQHAVDLLPEEYRKDVTLALKQAGDNTQELTKAITTISPQYRKGLAFLLANMPRRDLKELTAEFLVENVKLAYQARKEFPWGKDISEEIFFNYVLPYINVDETRENWRRDFYKQYSPVASKYQTIEEAALTLNKDPFVNLGITYDIDKRPRANQSPSETIEANFASCTGLSIMYVDILRSVGIPSRVVAVPRWIDNSGNHTWVEVWNNDTWCHIGAAEPTPFNQAWFEKAANETATANSTERKHRIYAVSFKKTGMSLPMAWSPDNNDVPAIDVTKEYIKNE